MVDLHRRHCSGTSSFRSVVVASASCAEPSLTAARGWKRSGPPSWPSVKLGDSGGEMPPTSNDLSVANVWSPVALLWI